MMAGVQNYMVKLKEVGTAFELDFEKVYWCSRLQQERDRLLAKMKPGQLLADIFCGCGPLAVRAARKGLFVIANDLNPYGYEYLVHNAKLNKVENKMICLNMCAREVMRKLYREKETLALSFQNPDHIYMNLPVDAIEFLDVFTNYGKEMKT
jgi:tRNA (guanine37-N1)-methyltransferase